MLYIIRTFDNDCGYELRPAAREPHLQRLETLKSEGRLVLAGPSLSADDKPTGSLIIAEFASQEEAHDWAKADPYNEAGVTARFDVAPFKQVF